MIIYKKHLKTNFKTLFLNFVALFLSIFALVCTINVINIEDEMRESILSTFPNSKVFSISKNGNNDVGSEHNIVQKVRPSIEEIKSIKFLNDIRIDYDLSYLLNDYTYKEDNLIINERILFEPHFLSNEIFYASGLEYDNFSIEFSKDFRIQNNEQSDIENFKRNISNFEFIHLKVFNFLSVPTIYYPYNLLKNAAETTYFQSISKNLYQFIAEKTSSEIETNYSLIGEFTPEKIVKFEQSPYYDLYELTNNPHEISNNFMTLFTTILDFGFYFLVVIIVLVLVLLAYTLYLIILKHHKEIALLRTYGRSKFFINSIYRFEILSLFFVAFIFAICFSIGLFAIINSMLMPGLNIDFKFSLNIELTTLVFCVCMATIMLLAQIPLTKVNKINIRKELNSI